MFKTVVLAAGVASISFCGAAVAADLPARSSVYTNPAPLSSWEGFYAGVHGGYASGDVDIVAGVGPTGSGSPKGGFGGFQIGYNYLVTPNWLLGYEVDASFGDIHDATAPFTPSNFKIDMFGTGRGRVGYVHGPWLLYATAGTAWAKPDWTVGGTTDINRVHVGWTAGAGVEYAFLPNWSAKVEYLYADFGETRRTFGATPINTDLTMSMVRAGLNYHFGGSVRPASASLAETPAHVATEWNGPYIGLHGGYGWGDFRSTVGGLGATTNLDAAGAFGGFQGGYNWQFAPKWVIGLESDSSWGSIKESAGATDVEIDEMGTVRGRLGYAVDKTLLYGTGGLAWAHVDSTTAGPVASDRYLLGWTAGAGVEYRFAPRWSAKIEYAYMNFPDVSETVAGATVNDKLDVHTIKIGLNYQASLLSLFTDN
jgi:outer membrane immunogenic protein